MSSRQARALELAQHGHMCHTCSMALASIFPPYRYTEKLQENLKVLAQMADNQYNQAQPQQGATQTQAPGQQAQGS
jgi:hypothetical protein